MADVDRLSRIFSKTGGSCHLCGGRLGFDRYGEQWEIEHSIPRSRGGTDHMNNLYAAHVSCNRSKQARSTRSTRSGNGLKCAPYTKAKREEVRNGNALTGIGIGALIGGVLLGPPGAWVGGAVGGMIGGAQKVDGWKSASAR